MVTDDRYYYCHNIITDYNECGDNNGGCAQHCVNMAGTYRCECYYGHSLLPNKRDCIRGGYINVMDVKLLIVLKH